MLDTIPATYGIRTNGLTTVEVVYFVGENACAPMAHSPLDYGSNSGHIASVKGAPHC